MKKSMIIAILIVYIASIVVVNFFGLEIKNFDGNIYVKDIQCNVVIQRETNAEVTVNSNVTNDDRVWYMFSFVQGNYDANNLEENPNVAFIDYRVYPDNAGNKRVKFIYDKKAAQGLCVFNEDIGTIYFLKKGGITVTLEAADGSKIKEKIFIVAK